MKYEPKNGWETADKKAVFDLSENYKKFLDNSKTERECVKYSIELAKKNGFVEYNKATKIKSGDKIYFNNHDKSLVLVVVGEKPITEGIRIVASHIDSPRLDLKPTPLYEDSELALFKTHYYGGIKKYQWTTIPLAMYGVVVKKDGTKIDISIGDNEGDSVFCVTDLLPHLASKQMSQKMNEGVTGENLNILLASMPANTEKDKIKETVLVYLNEKYGIEEEDFISAEIEVVPAGKSRDLGLDKSMILSYGHDDRVCGFGAFQSILETQDNKHTAICYLADKEEIGSEGTTGMMSEYLEYCVANLICNQNDGMYNELLLKECFANSACLSADVTAAYDPNFKEVYDSLNVSKLNYGIAICKYTGARGKSGSSDASAEYMGKIRKLCNDNNIIWQTGELGKVDEGGGGTVAQYLANRNIETIDCGVPVLSMHAPYEVVSKLDVFMSYKLYKVFYLD